MSCIHEVSMHILRLNSPSMPNNFLSINLSKSSRFVYSFTGLLSYFLFCNINFFPTIALSIFKNHLYISRKRGVIPVVLALTLQLLTLLHMYSFTNLELRRLVKPGQQHIPFLSRIRDRLNKPLPSILWDITSIFVSIYMDYLNSLKSF